MDLAQAFIFAVGWIFFAAWGAVLVTLSAVTFGRDIFRTNLRNTGAKSPD